MASCIKSSLVSVMRSVDGYSQWLMNELRDTAALAKCGSTFQTINQQSIGGKGRNHKKVMAKIMRNKCNFTFAGYAPQSATSRECIMILDSNAVSLCHKKVLNPKQMTALTCIHSVYVSIPTLS